MTTTYDRILQFKHLKNCGFFSDYHWDNSNKSDGDFSRLNIIYGPNGSGKTSLSRAIYGFVHNTLEYGSEVHLKIKVSGREREISDPEDPFLQRIYVLSDEYLNSSSYFEENSKQLSMPAVLTLGENAADRTKELKDKLNEREQKQKELESTKTQKEEKENSRAELLKTISQNVVNYASAGGERWKSCNKYSVKTVEKAYSSTAKYESLSNADFEEAHDTLRTDIQSALTQPIPPNFATEVKLMRKLNSSLSEVPVSKMLDTLEKNHHAENWVREGQQLHQDLNQCLFCGGELSDERKARINMHFSDAVNELNKELDSLERDLKKQLESLRKFMQELPDEMRLISNLRSRYLSARNDLNEELKRKEEYINELLNRIKEKKSNVFVSIDPVERFENQPNFETICKIIDEHNSFVGNYEEKLKKAASKIEHHCLAEKQDEYEKLNSSIDELKIKETKIEDSLAHINNRIEELSAPSGDPIPSADRLTHLLAEMLGRAELEFKCAGERYQVLRNGRPAERLSEGEIRAATLIHFFESVENQDLHGARPIIIIDDPVSSLDANVFAGISAYLWSEVVTKDKIDQLFLLTHNFELFRQWDIQISGLPKKDKEKDFSAKRLQLTSTYKNKVREPKITKWKSKKGTRSTYVQLFISLKEALDNCQNASDTNSYSNFSSYIQMLCVDF